MDSTNNRTFRTFQERPGITYRALTPDELTGMEDRTSVICAIKRPKGMIEFSTVTEFTHGNHHPYDFSIAVFATEHDTHTIYPRVAVSGSEPLDMMEDMLNQDWQFGLYIQESIS